MSNNGKLNRLINGSWEIIIEFDKNLRITQANQAALKILESQKSNLTKSLVTDLFDNRSQDLLQKTISGISNNGNLNEAIWIEGPLLCTPKNGRDFPAER